MSDRPQLVVWTSLWSPTLVAMTGEQEQRDRFSYALRQAMAANPEKGRPNVSNRQLSTAIGVDARTIAKWRKGLALPNLFESQRLAMALKVDETLFREPPEVPVPPPYPLERYLLEAGESGKVEGRRRATNDPPDASPGKPLRKPGRPAPAAEG